MTTVLATTSLAAEKPTKKAPSPKADSKRVYYYVFALLLGAMTIRQETIQDEASSLKQNALAQDELNEEMKGLKYEELPSGKVSQATINRIENQNTQLSKERQYVQNSLIDLRQSSQVQYTSANSNVDLVEQDAAENTGYLKTLYTIYKLINSIISPNK